MEKYNKNKTVPTFKVGDLVWLKRISIPTLTGNALNPKFDGPYRILSIIDKVTAWIIHVHIGTIIRRHFNHLKAVMYDEKEQIIVNTNWDIDLAEEKEPERRRSERLKKRN